MLIEFGFPWHKFGQPTPHWLTEWSLYMQKGNFHLSSIWICVSSEILHNILSGTFIRFPAWSLPECRQPTAPGNYSLKSEQLTASVTGVWRNISQGRENCPPFESKFLKAVRLLGKLSGWPIHSKTSQEDPEGICNSAALPALSLKERLSVVS